MSYSIIYSVPLRKQLTTSNCFKNAQNPDLINTEYFLVEQLMTQGSMQNFKAFSFGGWFKVITNAQSQQNLIAMCSNINGNLKISQVCFKLYSQFFFINIQAQINNNIAIVGVWMNTQTKLLTLTSTAFGIIQSIDLTNITYLNVWIPLMVTVNTSTNIATMRAAFTQNSYLEKQVSVTTANLFTTYPKAWMNIDAAYENGNNFNSCAQSAQVYFYHSTDEDYSPDKIQTLVFEAKKFPYLFFDFKEWESNRITQYQPEQILRNYQYDGGITALNGDTDQSEQTDAILRKINPIHKFYTYVLSTSSFITLPSLGDTSSFTISFILNYDALGLESAILMKTSDNVNVFKLSRNLVTKKPIIEISLFGGYSVFTFDLSKSGLRHTFYFECRFSGFSITLVNYYVDSTLIRQFTSDVAYYTISNIWQIGSKDNLGIQNEFSLHNLYIFRDSTVDLTSNLNSELQAQNCLLQATINSGYYSDEDRFCIICGVNAGQKQLPDLTGYCVQVPNNDTQNFKMPVSNMITAYSTKQLSNKTLSGLKETREMIDLYNQQDFLIIGYFKLTQAIKKPIPIMLLQVSSEYYIPCLLSVTSDTTLLLRYIPDSGTQVYQKTILLDQPISNRWIVLGISFQIGYKIMQFIYSRVGQNSLFYGFVSFPVNINASYKTWEACIACQIPGGKYDQYSGQISSLKLIVGIDNVLIIQQNFIDEQYFNIRNALTNPSIIKPVTYQSNSSSQMNIYQFSDYILSINFNLFLQCYDSYNQVYQGICIDQSQCPYQPSSLDPSYGIENALYSDDNLRFCLPCASNCLTCTVSPWQCSSCFDGYGLSGTKCILCPSGKYSDPTTNSCVATCPSGYSIDYVINSCIQKFSYVSNVYQFLALRLFDSDNRLIVLDSITQGIQTSTYILCSLFPDNYHTSLFSFLGGRVFTSNIVLSMSWNILPKNYAKRISFDVLFADDTPSEADVQVKLNKRQMTLESSKTVKSIINNMPCINYKQDSTINNRVFYKLSFYSQDNLDSARLEIKTVKDGWSIRNIKIEILKCHPTCDSCQKGGSSEDCTSIASSVAAGKCKSIDQYTNRCACLNSQYVQFNNCFSSPCFICTNCPNPLNNPSYYKRCEDLSGRVTYCGTGQHITDSYVCVPGSCGTTQTNNGFSIISTTSLYCQKQFDLILYHFIQSRMIQSTDYWTSTNTSMNPWTCQTAQFPEPFTDNGIMGLNIDIPFTQFKYAEMALLFRLLYLDFTYNTNQFSISESGTEIYRNLYSSNPGSISSCIVGGQTISYQLFNSQQVKFQKSDYKLSLQFKSEARAAGMGATFDEVQAKYIRCLPLCTQCVFDTSKPERQYCTQCQQNAELYTDVSTQKCKCSFSFFEYSDFKNQIDTCRPCSKGCKICSTPSLLGMCTQCLPGYTLSTDQCVSNCKFNEFYNGTSCQKCDDCCSSCNGPSSNSCESCQDSLYLQNNQCYFLKDNSKCQACKAATSSLCGGTQSNHNLCVQQGWVTKDSSTCINCSIKASTNCGGADTSLCTPLGYVSIGTNNCASCQILQRNGQCGDSSQNCATNGWVKFDDTSCINCGVSPNTLCNQCHPSCSTCSSNNSSISCTKCSGNRYLYNNQCLLQCPNGTKKDDQSNTCIECPNDKDLSTCFYGYRTCQNLDANIPNEQTSCLSCYPSRQLTSQGECQCKNTSDVRLNFYECSYNNLAVLEALLSYESPLLTIEFGSQLDIPSSVSFDLNQFTTDFCTYLFDSPFLILLGPQSKCSLSSSQIQVQLDLTSNLMEYDMVLLKPNILKFQGNSQNIDTFKNTIILQKKNPLQGQITYVYNLVENICNRMFIVHNSVLNDGQRGFKSIFWTVESISPPNDALKVALETNYLSVLNKNLGLDLIIERGVVPPETVVNLKLSFTMKITSIGENIFQFKFIVQKILHLDFKSSLINPFFLSKSGIIALQYYVTLCNQYGDPQTANEPVDITIVSTEAPTLNYQEMGSIKSEYLISIPTYFLAQGQQLINIKAILALSLTPTVKETQSFSFFVQATDLQVKITGFSGQIDYKKDTTLTSSLRDLDNPITLESAQNIDTEWICINPLDYKMCQYQDGTELKFDANLKSITIPAFTFVPYTVVQIKLIGKHAASKRQMSDEKVMYFSELELPGLNVVMNLIDANKATVNINEEIYAQLLYQDDQNTDVDLLSFSGTIVYQDNVVGIIKFDFSTVRFQIWNYYNGFQNDRLQISIRFSVFNPRYFMPSMSIIPLLINFPPQNCFFTVKEIEKHPLTLEMLYGLSMDSCVDNDQPLQYQFYFYNDDNERQHEILNPLQVKRKQVKDISSSNTLKTYLPAGKLVLLAQAVDSKQAIFNSTYSLTVAEVVYDEQRMSDIIDFRLQLSSTQPPQNAVTDLSVFSEDLCKRTIFLTSTLINKKKLLIVLQLQLLSKQLPQISTSITLVNKAIASLLACGAGLTDITSQQNFFTDMDNLLTQQPPQAILNLDISKELFKQKVFDNFQMLDSISSQISAKDSGFYAKQLDLANKIGQQMLQNVLPNEDQKLFIGKKIKILSQQITQKNVCSYFFCDPQTGESSSSSGGTSNINSITNLSTDPVIYNMRYSIYQDNPYQSDDSFKEYSNNVTKALNGTGQVSNYEVVAPLLQNAVFSPISLKQMIAIPFNVKGTEKKQMTCLSKDQGKWTQSGCKNIFNEQTMIYTCTCPNLNPTTVIDDITALIHNENIKTVFSSQGITNIANFDNFYDYAVFWAISSQTVLLILLIIKAKALDAAASTRLTDILKQSPQIHPLKAEKLNDDEKIVEDDDILNYSIEMNIKQNNILENNKNDLENQDDIENNPGVKGKNEFESKDSRKEINLSPNEPEMNKIEKKPSLNNDDIGGSKHKLNKSNIVNLGKTPSTRKNVRRISKTTSVQSEQWWAQIKSGSKPTLIDEKIKELDQEKKEEATEKAANIQLETKISNVTLQKRESIPDSQRRTSIGPTIRSGRRRASGSENSLLALRRSKSIIIKKNEASSFFSISRFKQIILFHNFFGIFYIYHPTFSRSFRFCIFYIRLVHSLSVAIFFDQNYSYIQQGVISVLNALMIIIIIKILECLVSIKRVGKLIVSVLLLSILGFYYYLMLAIVSGKSPSESNGCLIPFSILSGGDIIIISTLSALVQNWISQRVLKLGEIDGWKKSLFEFLQLNLIIQNLLH